MHKFVLSHVEPIWLTTTLHIALITLYEYDQTDVVVRQWLI